MILDAHKRELKSALDKISGATASNNTKPILKHYYIEGGVMKATDLEVGIRTNFNCNIIEDGSAVFPNQLRSIINELPNEQVRIKVDDDLKATITCQNSEFELSCFDGDEFPQLPEVENAQEIIADGRELSRQLKKASISISDDESQPALTGLHLDGSEAVSTNTYRLAMVNINESINTCINVPEKAVKEIISHIKNEDGINLFVADNYIKVKTINGTVISRLIEGNFPNYQQVIPDNCEVLVQADTTELGNAVKRASIIAKTDSNVIELSFDDETLTIIGKGENNTATEKVPIQKQGDDMKINIDAGYLLEGLKVLGENEVTIELIDKLSPLVINESGFTYLVMPIRSDD